MAKNTGAPPPRDDLEPVDLFGFLRVVAIAHGRGRLSRMQAAVAILTASDSTGTTGTGVVVNAADHARELGLSERQVWRHFKALVDAGWFVQTVTPTRGYDRAGGRRARYRLTWPAIDLGLLDAEKPPKLSDEDSRLPFPSSDLSDDNAEFRVTDSQVEPSVDNADSPESSDGFDHNRLTVSAKSSDTREREIGTLSTSGGTPSDELPTTPVPQQPKPQDARGHVEKPTRDRAAAMAGFGLAMMRAGFDAASKPRHARPGPDPVARPDRE